MKKYLGFLLTFMLAALFSYMAYTDYRQENLASMSGQYISSKKDRGELAYQLSLAQQVAEPQWRSAALQKVNTLRESLVQVAKPLGLKVWAERYMSEGRGNMSAFFVAIALAISILWYANGAISEQIKKSKSVAKTEAAPVERTYPTFDTGLYDLHYKESMAQVQADSWNNNPASQKSIQPQAQQVANVLVAGFGATLLLITIVALGKAGNR